MSHFAVERIQMPNAADVAAVASMEAEAFGRGGLNEWHLPVFARHGRLYVVKQGETTVGAASILRSWDPTRAFLFDLVVDSSRRRRGVASSLMRTIIRELSEEGITFLELTTARDNSGASRLYGGLGFTAVADLPDEYGPGRHRQLLRLDLRRVGRHVEAGE